MSEPEQAESPVAAATTDPATDGDGALRAFFYSIADLPALSIVDMAQGLSEDQQQEMYDAFGRELLTKVILSSPELSVYHEQARPGERVKRHRHGTHQITYVLRGSLRYGNRETTAGMGYFSPDRPYSWIAGDEGAEWIEIHAGQPRIIVE